MAHPTANRPPRSRSGFRSRVWACERLGVTRVFTQRSLPARPRNVRNRGRDPRSPAPRRPVSSGRFVGRIAATLRGEQSPGGGRGSCRRLIARVASRVVNLAARLLATAESEPDRPALVGPEALTYGELAARSAAVAAAVARRRRFGRPRRDRGRQRGRLRRGVSRGACGRRRRGAPQRRITCAGARTRARRRRTRARARVHGERRPRPPRRRSPVGGRDPRRR